MDYIFHGDPNTVSKAVHGSDGSVLEGIALAGPRVLDGISYASVRTDGNASFTIPEGCSITTPELSAALLGRWYDAAKAPEQLKEMLAEGERGSPAQTPTETTATPTTETTQETKKGLTSA